VSEDSTSRVIVLPVRVLTTEKHVKSCDKAFRPKRELTDLHTATKTEDEMEGGFFLDIVIRKGATVLKLLTSKDQALLVRGNALLVLDLGLDIVDSIGGLNFESDGLAGDCANVSMMLEIEMNEVAMTPLRMGKTYES
jgi:hypothetical protein